MLRIHTATIAAAVKRYFELADYYAEGQETVGQWFGGLAKRLGLIGKVTKEAFERLCDNRHPFEDKTLTARTGQKHRVGNDFVFSGPKSFAVIEGLAEPAEKARLLAMFDEAINETLAEDIEPDMQARVRKDGAFTNRVTGNLLAAGYDHSTARPVDEHTPPDMHRHRHVFVFNATYDPVERRIKAAECGDIIRDAPFYQAAFFARLANKLEGAGYVIDRRAGGLWEIAGVPQSVIDTFSKRTGEIEAEADRLGITYAEDKAVLGAKTRANKQKDLTPDQLRRAWDAQLDDAEREALARVYAREIPAGPEVTPAEAIEYAKDHLSEQWSVFPEREAKRVALLHGIGSVTPRQVAEELPRHGVVLGELDGRRMATTPELQGEERYLVGVAANGRGQADPVGVPDELERGTLNNGQWRAVRSLLASTNRVNLVEGPAGAGKSTMLQAYDQGTRLAGEKVTYLATTAAAVGVLANDGFETNTVARFLLDESLQKSAKGGRVVVDEISLLGHKDAVSLFRLADKLDLKLILIGDPRQHGSVARGSMMRLLTEHAGIKPYRLTEILRQETPDYRAVATLLSEGKAAEGFAALDSLGWVKELDGDERYRQMGEDYLDARKGKTSWRDVLVISPTHREAAAITAEIRRQLREAGKIGEKDTPFTRLVPTNASEAERRQEKTYRQGDVLVFHQNAKGFKKGDRLTVADPAAVPLAEAARFSIYRPEEIRLAKGDIIRFTGNVRTLDGRYTLKNGAAHAIAEITPGGDIRLDTGRLIGKDAGFIRHGLVETSFGSQGRTVKRTLLGMAAESAPAINAEQLYVSSSRAKERTTIYTDDKEAIEAAIRRSSAKAVALDLAAVPAARKRPEPARYRERRRRLAYFERLRSVWRLVAGGTIRRPLTHAERLTHGQGKDQGHGYGY